MLYMYFYFLFTFCSTSLLWNLYELVQSRKSTCIISCESYVKENYKSVLIHTV